MRSLRMGRNVTLASAGRKRGLAIATAAVLAAGTLQAHAGIDYTWNTFSSGGSADWATPADWTGGDGVTQYPGSGTAPDDTATIAPSGPIGGGAYTITESSPLPAGSIAALTLDSSLATTSGDQLVLNVNSNMAVSGNVSLKSYGASNSTGQALLVIGSGGSLNVNGTLTTTNYSAVTINGNLTTSAFDMNTSNETGQVTINTPGTVNLGNVNVQKTYAVSGSTTISSGNASSANGLHLQAGTVTANDFLFGTNNSSAYGEIAGGSLTISGQFILGNNSTTTTRYSELYQSNGTVVDTNPAGLVIGDGTGNAGSAGLYYLRGGTLTLEQLTLGGDPSNITTTSSYNYGVLFISGGTLYLGSGGLNVVNIAQNQTTGYSKYVIQVTGGTFAAKANWSTNAGIQLTSGTTTFQAADANNNPFDIAISGSISKAGNLVKTGGGTLTLSGSNSYTGSTTVSAGSLIITGATTSTSSVSVASGALLGGNGTISGTVDVSGTLAPGSGGTGALTLTGSTTLEPGAALSIALGSAGSSTQLAMTNSATLTGSGITLDISGNIDTSTPYSIITGVSGGLSNVDIEGYDKNAYTASLTNDGTQYLLSFTATSAVPEPAAVSMLGLGLGGLFMRRRRRLI